MIRTVKRGLAAGLLVAGGMAMPALAHDQEHKQKIIIMTEGHGDGERQEGAVEHRGSQLVIAECGGDKTEVSAGSEAKGEKARIVICNRGNVSAADRAKRLEHVIERINSDNELSAETRAKITTALRDAITRLNKTH